MAQAGGKRVVLIVLGVIGGVVVLGCCGTCVALGLIGQQQNAAQAAVFQELAGVCAGRPAPSAAAVGTAGGAVRAQAYDSDGDLLSHWLPTEQRSASVADTELVICQGELVRWDMESCDYETGFVTGVTGGRNIIERRAWRRDYRVVDARTGAERARRTFDGRPPPPCPESAEFDTGGDTETLYGDPPEPAEVHRWLTEVAAGAR